MYECQCYVQYTCKYSVRPTKKKRNKTNSKKKSDSDGFQIVICVTIFPGGQEVETSISKRRAFSYPVYDWFIIFVWKPHVGFTYNNNLTSCCKASLTLHSGCIENKMKRAFLRTFVPLIGLLPTLHDMVVFKVLFKNNNNCFAFSFFSDFPVAVYTIMSHIFVCKRNDSDANGFQKLA